MSHPLPHTWRLLFPLLLLLPVASFAQDQVRLRLAYRGQFLPEGTAIVVLGQRADVPPDSVIQPQFLSRVTYPRTGPSVVLRDTIGPSGLSRKGIPRSSDARMRYFIYALTPDGRLYWSYSALRDALKFDVVEKGVMSIAPVSDPVAASDIEQLFFRDPPEHEPASEPATAASDDTPSPPSLDAPPSPDRSDEEVTEGHASEPENEAATAKLPTDASASTGGLVPLWLFLLALLAPSSLAAYFIHRYLQARQEIAGMRSEMTELRTELAARFFRSNPDSAEREERTPNEGPSPSPPRVGNPIDPKRWNP